MSAWLYSTQFIGSYRSLDTIHTILVTHMVYTYLVTDFGDYTALQGNIWSFNLHVFVTTIVACMSQIFFIHRCWTLDKGKINTFFSCFILLVAFTQVGFGIACTAITFSRTQYVQFLEFTWAVDTWLGAAAACDILVSAAIVRSLWRSRTGIPRTNNLIIRLILWTVNTGIITSLWAILDIALFTASKDTLIHDFFNVMLAKLYANTLLATLNHRRPTNGDDDSYDAKNISLSRVSRPRAFPGRETDTAVNGVHIMTHTIQNVDDVKDPQRPLYVQHAEGPSWSGDSTDGKASHWVDEDSAKASI